MTVIGPISGAAAPMMKMPAAPVQAPAAQVQAPAQAEAKESQFTDALRACLNRADQDQQKVVAAVGDLLTGGTQDVLPAVTAVAQSDLSFKLLIGVRNKVIEAYKQTLSMQM
jgi:flagellar hook-basal body complex protein FliE